LTLKCIKDTNNCFGFGQKNPFLGGEDFYYLFERNFSGRKTMGALPPNAHTVANGLHADASVEL